MGGVHPTERTRRAWLHCSAALRRYETGPRLRPGAFQTTLTGKDNAGHTGTRQVTVTATTSTVTISTGHCVV